MYKQKNIPYYNFITFQLWIVKEDHLEIFMTNIKDP
jgi:hypothetical protein